MLFFTNGSQTIYDWSFTQEYILNTKFVKYDEYTCLRKKNIHPNIEDNAVQKKSCIFMLTIITLRTCILKQLKVIKQNHAFNWGQYECQIFSYVSHYSGLIPFWPLENFRKASFFPVSFSQVFTQWTIHLSKPCAASFSMRTLWETVKSSTKSRKATSIAFCLPTKWVTLS